MYSSNTKQPMKHKRKKPKDLPLYIIESEYYRGDDKKKDKPKATNRK